MSVWPSTLSSAPAAGGVGVPPVLPAPAGFTETGLPVGLQIIGPPRGEAAVLGAAALLEQATGNAGRLPIDPTAADGTRLVV